MTKESEIPVAAKLITEYLEYYSQKNYGSGWELNIEYLIWHKLISQDVEFPKSGRFWNWHGVDIIQLRKLAAECKGWVCFNHSAYAYATDDYISVFIPMDKWLKQYEEYAGRAMTNEQQQRFDTFMNGNEQGREKLLNHAAAVALAIQSSGHEIHHDFQEILKMIPDDLKNKQCKNEFLKILSSEDLLKDSIFAGDPESFRPNK